MASACRHKRQGQPQAGDFLLCEPRILSWLLSEALESEGPGLAETKQERGLKGMRTGPPSHSKPWFSSLHCHVSLRAGEEVFLARG